MSRDTQNERLLAYLKQHHFVTRLIAARPPLLIMNLWCRIAEIEDELGYKLDRRKATTRTGKRVLEYWWRSSAKARKAA
jgi:hypothetical protein